MLFFKPLTQTPEQWVQSCLLAEAKGIMMMPYFKMIYHYDQKERKVVDAYINDTKGETKAYYEKIAEPFPESKLALILIAWATHTIKKHGGNDVRVMHMVGNYVEFFKRAANASSSNVHKEQLLQLVGESINRKFLSSIVGFDI